MNKFLWAGRKIKLKNLELLKEIAQETDIELEIISGISHAQLQEKIRDSYAVILPSFSEVCPNFILEAVSLGKPFIMTKETGLMEIYNKGGIFVDPFDKKALKEAILSMLEPKEYQKYQMETANLDSHHSWQEIAQEFLNI